MASHAVLRVRRRRDGRLRGGRRRTGSERIEELGRRTGVRLGLERSVRLTRCVRARGTEPRAASALARGRQGGGATARASGTSDDRAVRATPPRRLGRGLARGDGLATRRRTDGRGGTLG